MMSLVETETTPQNTKKKSWLFPPGKSANPAGRPKGARHKLTELFWHDLYAKWIEHGASAIEEMIKKRPGDFVRVVASVLPAELHIIDRTDARNWTKAELAEWLSTITIEHDPSGGGGIAPPDGGEREPDQVHRVDV